MADRPRSIPPHPIDSGAPAAKHPAAPSPPGVTRRQALQFSAVGAVLGLGFTAGCGRTGPGSMMGGMIGAATSGDMSAYMELFARHSEIRRTVEEVPGGVRTVTESAAPDLAARLEGHVANMYEHLNRGAEVRCMSPTLPTLFEHARGYRRDLTLTGRGVAVTETSDDPRLTAVIRAHAREVTGFVRDGMPAMMRG